MWYLNPKLWLAVGVVSTSFAAGWLSNGWRWDAKHTGLQLEYAQAQAEAGRIALELKVAQTDAYFARQFQLDETERANAATSAALEAETRTITETVIEYVQTNNASKCGVDSDGVRIINRAAGVPSAGTSTEATGPTDAAAGTVVASVVDNYSACRLTAKRLEDLQEWVGEVVRRD